MALRALMLKKKIDEKRAELKKLQDKSEELQKREAELEEAIEEAKTDEERTACEEAVTAFEKEKAENAEQLGQLEREVQQAEADLEKEEEAQDVTQPAPEQEETRKDDKKMENRTKFFGMTMQERDQFIAREDVQNFLAQVRSAMKEKRAITGAGYLIPTVVLGLLRENVERYSKLYNRVNVRRVSGESRMIVQGAIPEAVWTEMCANLNELDLSFSQVEVDGFKVGGYFRICNATLEDSDIDLAAELINVLGQAIGYALDKAIIAGTGTKMPEGVLTALLAADGTPNVVSIPTGTTGTDLWKAIVTNTGKAKSNYSRGAKTWVMNETTYTNIIAESVSVDASGAIVAGVNGVMPVIGGDIEVLNFMPDNVVVGGYFDTYLLAERAGTRINTSEHAFWIEDQTGFKGTARYDGKVLVNNAFVAIGLNGVTPSAAGFTFAPDTANQANTEEEGA